MNEIGYSLDQVYAAVYSFHGEILNWDDIIDTIVLMKDQPDAIPANSEKDSIILMSEENKPIKPNPDTDSSPIMNPKKKTSLLSEPTPNRGMFTDKRVEPLANGDMETPLDEFEENTNFPVIALSPISAIKVHKTFYPQIIDLSNEKPECAKLHYVSPTKNNTDDKDEIIVEKCAKPLISSCNTSEIVENRGQIIQHSAQGIFIDCSLKVIQRKITLATQALEYLPENNKPEEVKVFLYCFIIIN